jgi:putative hydrolase of the HAD superfamily
MRGYFCHAVQRRHEEARAAGIAWPEVRAEEIWAEYEGPVPADWEVPEQAGADPRGRALGRERALRYELAVNPVYPMPGAESLLRALAKNSYVAGIISNAQFYTPLLFNAFFDASPEELRFDPELLIYSFEEGEAKPSPRLFAKARDILARKNISPREILYIGNDMRNDIIPAAEAGFVTSLFAGDRRSLRLREAEFRADGRAGAKPDLVLDSLAALEKALIKTDN